MGTDRDWEAWGQNDPYYGVLSKEDFRIGALSADAKQAFFKSGEQHVNSVLDTIRKTFSAEFRPLRSLDFGCGVGRLLIPLALQSDYATGVDVSPSMLAETASNCAAMHVSNVDLIGSDDNLSEVRGEYDLVHSHIVFAHIESRRGNMIIEALAKRVSRGGFIAVQVLYSCNATRWKRGLVKLRYRLPALNALRNLLRGRPLREPAMQLHVYNLPKLLRMLRQTGFGSVLLVTDAFDNDQFDSVLLIAQRQTAPDR